MKLKITKETSLDGTVHYYIWRDNNIIGSAPNELSIRAQFVTALEMNLPKTEVLEEREV